MIGLFKKFLHPRSSRGLRDPVRSPGEGQLTLRNADRNSTTPSEFRTNADDESSDSSCRSHWDLALQLRPSFPPACSWLEPSDLQDIGEPVIDGGRFADVRRGHLEGKEVAVKSYRHYIHFDCDRVRMVGHNTPIRPARVLLTPHLEVPQGSTRIRPPLT